MWKLLKINVTNYSYIILREVNSEYNFKKKTRKAEDGHLHLLSASNVQVPYFAIYNVHIFLQIFEEKIRMCIIHG